MGSDWNFSNTYLLVLMSLGYIVGELDHFLINTTSRFEMTFQVIASKKTVAKFVINSLRHAHFLKSSCHLKYKKYR